MRNRHIMPIYWIMMYFILSFRLIMNDKLVPVKVIISPELICSSFTTLQHLTVKVPRCLQVIHWDGKMERMYILIHDQAVFINVLADITTRYPIDDPRYSIEGNSSKQFVH